MHFLLDAARDGNVGKVLELLYAGANIDQRRHPCGHEVHLAAQNGHLGAIKAFVAADVNIDQPDMNGWTPLCSAAQQGHLDVVSELVAAGAHVNQASKGGATPLFLAALKGYEVASRALEAPPHHPKNHQPCSVLLATMPTGSQSPRPPYHAMVKSSVDVVTVLLMAGARVLDMPRQYPLDHAKAMAFLQAWRNQALQAALDAQLAAVTTPAQQADHKAAQAAAEEAPAPPAPQAAWQQLLPVPQTHNAATFIGSGCAQPLRPTAHLATHTQPPTDHPPHHTHPQQVSLRPGWRADELAAILSRQAQATPVYQADLTAYTTPEHTPAQAPQLAKQMPAHLPTAVLDQQAATTCSGSSYYAQPPPPAAHLATRIPPFHPPTDHPPSHSHSQTTLPHPPKAQPMRPSRPRVDQLDAILARRAQAILAPPEQMAPKQLPHRTAEGTVCVPTRQVPDAEAPDTTPSQDQAGHHELLAAWCTGPAEPCLPVGQGIPESWHNATQPLAPAALATQPLSCVALATQPLPLAAMATQLPPYAAPATQWPPYADVAPPPAAWAAVQPPSNQTLVVWALQTVMQASALAHSAASAAHPPPSTAQASMAPTQDATDVFSRPQVLVAQAAALAALQAPPAARTSSNSSADLSSLAAQVTQLLPPADSAVQTAQLLPPASGAQAAEPIPAPYTELPATLGHDVWHAEPWPCVEQPILPPVKRGPGIAWVVCTPQAIQPLPPAALATQPLPPAALATQQLPPAALATQPQPPAALATQPLPPAALATQPLPPAALATQQLPPAALATQPLPPAALATQPLPLAALATQQLPLAALATQLLPPAALATQPQPPATPASQPASNPATARIPSQAAAPAACNAVQGQGDSTAPPAWSAAQVNQPLNHQAAGFKPAQPSRTAAQATKPSRRAKRSSRLTRWLLKQAMCSPLLASVRPCAAHDAHGASSAAPVSFAAQAITRTPVTPAQPEPAPEQVAQPHRHHGTALDLVPGALQATHPPGQQGAATQPAPPAAQQPTRPPRQQGAATQPKPPAAQQPTQPPRQQGAATQPAPPAAQQPTQPPRQQGAATQPAPPAAQQPTQPPRQQGAATQPAPPAAQQPTQPPRQQGAATQPKPPAAQQPSQPSRQQGAATQPAPLAAQPTRPLAQDAPLVCFSAHKSEWPFVQELVWQLKAKQQVLIFIRKSNSVDAHRNWFRAARSAKVIVSIISQDYLNSPTCCREYNSAECLDKMLVVLTEPVRELRTVAPTDANKHILMYMNQGRKTLPAAERARVTKEVLKRLAPWKPAAAEVQVEKAKVLQ